jgi:hypothetical protein
MPSADFCEAVREDSSALSPTPGHPADLPRSAVIPSVPRRRIYTVRPSCGWRTSWWRAHSSRAYHTSYPVRVPRPAPSFHASFRPHLTVTPWRFPCPSAPRTPGRGTFTPKHDSMPGTHRDRGEPRGSRPPTPPDRRVTYPAVRWSQGRSQPSLRLGRPSVAKERWGSAIASAGL